MPLGGTAAKSVYSFQNRPEFFSLNINFLPWVFHFVFWKKPRTCLTRLFQEVEAETTVAHSSGAEFLGAPKIMISQCFVA